MKALFVYRYCTMGGVETGLRFRLQHLPEHGINAHALFLRDHGGSSAFAALNGRVFFGGDDSSFRQLLAQHRYDLVSIIDSFDVLSWLRDARYQGSIVVELRSTYQHTLSQLRQMAGHRINAIVVPSEFQSQNVRDYLPRELRDRAPVFVVPNCVDLEQFSYVRVERAADGPPIICWIGRIDPLKNWAEFLQIAARLRDSTGAEFWMVGGGRSEQAARDELRRTVGKLGLASRLRWWPLVANPDMPRLYSLVADSGGCVLLTSRCESFGFAALEALACGCPLVATRAGGIPEIVQDGVNGLLYPIGQVEQAAGLVQKVLADHELRGRLREQAQRSVRERFNHRVLIGQFARTLRQAIDAPCAVLA